MKQRQIRWNVHSKNDPERHEYIFLIINTNHEAETITQKFQEILQPVDEVRIITEGAISKTGLRYRLLGLTSYGKSPNENLKWSRIYKGTVARDRELYERQSPDGLKEFIDSQMNQ